MLLYHVYTICLTIQVSEMFTKIFQHLLCTLCLYLIYLCTLPLFLPVDTLIAFFLECHLTVFARTCSKISLLHCIYNTKKKFIRTELFGKKLRTRVLLFPENFKVSFSLSFCNLGFVGSSSVRQHWSVESWCSYRNILGD